MKIKSNIRMDSYGAVLISTILSVYIMGKDIALSSSTAMDSFFFAMSSS